MRLTLLLSALLLAAPLAAQTVPAGIPSAAPYKNPHLSADARAADALKRMTLEEKAAMLSGSAWMDSAPVPRLGIPAIKMADGPMGVRSWAGSSSITNSVNNPAAKVESTAFPSGIDMAATWDTDLVQREGVAIGEEVKALGRDMILGPTVNINRAAALGPQLRGLRRRPLSLRPASAWLTSRACRAKASSPPSSTSPPTTKSSSAIASTSPSTSAPCTKSTCPPSKPPCRKRGVWTVMSAYNKVNGIYCARSIRICSATSLQEEFGFKGFVVSDWGSTYSTAPTVNAGMDLEMPGGPPMQAWLARPRRSKRQRRRLAHRGQSSRRSQSRQHHRSHHQRQRPPHSPHHLPERHLRPSPHRRRRSRHARPAHHGPQGATEGIVLLKNENALLPLDTKAGKFSSPTPSGPRLSSTRAAKSSACACRRRSGGTDIGNFESYFEAFCICAGRSKIWSGIAEAFREVLKQSPES